MIDRFILRLGPADCFGGCRLQEIDLPTFRHIHTGQHQRRHRGRRGNQGLGGKRGQIVGWSQGRGIGAVLGDGKDIRPGWLIGDDFIGAGRLRDWLDAQQEQGTQTHKNDGQR